MKQVFINKLTEADLILIGIGSEFEKKKLVCQENAVKALEELRNLLDGKNYFLITTCTNSILKKVGFALERIVSPCGNLEWKQCPNQCESTLIPLLEEELQQLNPITDIEEKLELGKCPICGEALVLNNVYATKYNENSYLEDWKRYTKWLQGTLNKKVCVMELGVDLVFPSIIRWPFEKVAFYNKKAEFIRVNERLYHMSEELKDKGISIGKNAIDWLLEKEI